MNIRIFKAAGRQAFALAAIIAVSSFIYGCETRDDRSDCTVEMAFRFEYVLNKDRTDYFTGKAEQVDLYIYNSRGAFVKKVHASRAAGTLGSDNSVSVTLPHGHFTAVAWANCNDDFDCMYDCNIENKRVNLKTQGGQVAAAPSDLMHGKTGFIANNKESQAGEIVIGMTKNTNKVTVVLHTSGNLSPVEDNAFTIGITGSNGTYKYDNSLADSGLLNYIPQYSRPSANRFEAEFNVMRLLCDDDTKLSLGRTGTRAGIALPLEESLTGAIMRHPDYNTDQDLDRYDDYVLEYEVDLSNENAATAVLIKVNDWSVVEQGGGL